MRFEFNAPHVFTLGPQALPLNTSLHELLYLVRLTHMPRQLNSELHEQHITYTPESSNNRLYVPHITYTPKTQQWIPTHQPPSLRHHHQSGAGSSAS
jgi:hypothetical protein